MSIQIHTPNSMSISCKRTEKKMRKTSYKFKQKKISGVQSGQT